MNTLQEIPTTVRLRELADHVDGLPHQPLRCGWYRPGHAGTETFYRWPRGFNMSTYAAAQEGRADLADTAANLAGHACALWTEDPAHTWDMSKAQVALGLRRLEARALFVPVTHDMAAIRPECTGTLSHIEPATAAEACRRLADIRGAEYVHGDRWEDWVPFVGAHDNAAERLLTRRLWGTLETLMADAELYDGILCPTCGEDFTLDLVCWLCEARRVRRES